MRTGERMGSEVLVGRYRVHSYEDATGKHSIWIDNRQVGVYYASTDNCILFDRNGSHVLCVNANTIELLVEILRDIRD